MFKSRAVLLSAVLAACAFTSPLAFAGASKSKVNKGTEVTKPSESSLAIGTVATATALARYGDANRDALALIQASKMLKAVGATEAAQKRTSGKGGDKPAKADPYTADAVLARAKELAKDNPALSKLADDVAVAGARGVVNGAKHGTSVVSSNDTDSYRIRYEGDAPAAVFVSGDGDSDLDLFVYDENDNLICSDTDATDDMLCRWNPRWTGSFTIRIKNLGVANRYRLWTN